MATAPASRSSSTVSVQNRYSWTMSPAHHNSSTSVRRASATRSAGTFPCTSLTTPIFTSSTYAHWVRRTIFEEEHELFRTSFRQFVDKELVPHTDEWERAGIVDRDVFRKAGDAGFLGMAVPEELGGGGVDDYRYNQVILEEIQLAGVGTPGMGIGLHNDVCLPYFLHGYDEEQKKRWLPGFCSGELITAVAMTEPGAGSDLAGTRPTD